MRQAKEDMAKLPQWARFRIEKLESDLQYFTRKLDQVEGNEKTNTFMGSDVAENLRRLPNNETISFYIGNMYLKVRIENDRITLQASDVMGIFPRASNAAWITLRPY